MNKFPDIAHYYTPERAAQEEAMWALEGTHHRDAAFLQPHLDAIASDRKSVIEFGCGSGILASLLTGIDYMGVDKNPWFLERARARNFSDAPGAQRHFCCFDVRNYHSEQRDCAVALSFLKHFALDEWNAVVAQVLRHGHHGCIEMQIAEEDHDDGEEYHHVYVTVEHLRRAVENAGHRIEDMHVERCFQTRLGKAAKRVLYWTKMVERPKTATVAVLGKKYQTVLWVGGSPVRPLERFRYSLRWVMVPGGNDRPVLYCDGKRVVKSWSLEMDVSSDADPSGENANTGDA